MLSADNTSIDIKIIFPNDYQDFTADNFFIKSVSASAQAQSAGKAGTIVATASVKLSYNAETGILSGGSSMRVHADGGGYTATSVISSAQIYAIW